MYAILAVARWQKKEAAQSYDTASFIRL
jgi:hypothetical protein